MKTLAIIFVTFTLLSFRVQAANFPVKASGGGRFTTIQACAQVASAGDTCTVFAGTYNETVTPANSGSNGAPITFQVNPGDCVTVTGWNLASLSYITIGTPGGSTCTKSGVSFSGFEITGGHITWVTMNHIVIQNNYLHDTTPGKDCLSGTIGNQNGPSTYVSVLNNTFTYCGGTSYPAMSSSMYVEGNHWLIDGNNISHVSEGMQVYGDRHVVRNNTIGPVTAVEEGANHGDGLESSCSGDFPLTHLLWENNTTHDWRGSNNHGFLLRDTQSCGMNLNIIRLSSFFNLGSDWISNDTNSIGGHYYNNSVSNTGLDSGLGRESLTFTNGDTNSKVINNIIINTTSTNPGTPWCVYVDPSSVTGFVEHHNLCFNSGYSSAWTGPSSNGGTSYSSTDLFNRSALFIDAAQDLHLQAGSPAFGAGGSVVTAVGAGSNNTSLTVADAGFFSDGYGIPNVQPDWIRIGPSGTVQISSINYSTNVITLATPASWSSGTPIYLYKDSNGNVVLNGANPDIGVANPQSLTPPPSNLQAFIN